MLFNSSHLQGVSTHLYCSKPYWPRNVIYRLRCF